MSSAFWPPPPSRPWLVGALLAVGCAHRHAPEPVSPGWTPFAAVAPSEKPAVPVKGVGRAAAEGASRDDRPVPEAVSSLLTYDAVRAGRAVGPRLTLPEAIRSAVLRDPAIREALADVEAAQAEHVRSATIPNPQFAVVQTMLPFPSRPFTPERTGGPPQFDAAIGYSLDFIVFGKQAAAMERDRRAVDAAHAAHADRVRTRVLEAVEGFFEVLERRAEWVLALDVHGHAKRLQDLTDTRGGSAASAERGRVRLFVLAKHRNVLRAEAALEQARALLRRSLALRPGEPTPEPEGPLEVDRVAAVPELAEILRTAFEQRPDLEQARRNVSLARAQIGREHAEGWPALAAVGVVTHQFQSEAIGAPNVWSWGAGLAGTLPVFDRNQGGIARAEAEAIRAGAQLSDRQLAVRAEVEAALAAFRAAQKAMAEEDAGILRAAQEMRDSVRQAYKAGARSLIEVIDSEQAFDDATRLAIEARASYLRAVHRLNASVGRAIVN